MKNLKGGVLLIALVALLSSCTTKSQPFTREVFLRKIDSVETVLTNKFDSIERHALIDSVKLRKEVDGPANEWQLWRSDSLLTVLKQHVKEQKVILADLQSWRRVRAEVEATKN